MIPLQRTSRDYAIGDLDRGGKAWTNIHNNREHIRLRRLEAFVPTLGEPAPPVLRRGNGADRRKLDKARAHQMSWVQLCMCTGVSHATFRYMVGKLGIHPRDALTAGTTKNLTQEMWDRRWTYAGK